MADVKVLPSLRKDSKAVYFPCQIRKTGSAQARLQVSYGSGKHFTEETFVVSEELAEYLGQLPMPHNSLAGTGTKYASARVTVHPDKDNGGKNHPIRLQIEGPKINRDWGVEFLLDSYEVHSAIGGLIAQMTVPPPTEEENPLLGKHDVPSYKSTKKVEEEEADEA